MTKHGGCCENKMNVVRTWWILTEDGVFWQDLHQRTITYVVTARSPTQLSITRQLETLVFQTRNNKRKTQKPSTMIIMNHRQGHAESKASIFKHKQIIMIGVSLVSFSSATTARRQANIHPPRSNEKS